MVNDQGEKFYLITNAIEAHLYTYLVDIISLTPHIQQHLPTFYFEPVFSVVQLVDLFIELNKFIYIPVTNSHILWNLSLQKPLIM